MQVKLLRAIQEKAVKAIGGVEEIGVDTRILSATHKNLEHEVEIGNFRQDLYYRLNVIKLDVPTLQARGDDILLLAEHFLDLIAERWQMPKAQLSNKAIEHLSNYNFPGNVRELENILERACTLADGEFIEPTDLQLSTANIDMSQPRLDIPRREIAGFNNKSEDESGTELLCEKDQIIDALNKTRWNRTAAAKTLGMTFRQLRYRIKKYELDQTL